MSENLGLGKLITTTQQRDAIHVAVAPLVAAANLRPAQHFALDAMGRATTSGAFVGIVDPFLWTGPNEGQQFWGFLYPNTVSGMRHRWRHPAFPDEQNPGVTEAQSAEAWLRRYAVRVRPYDRDKGEVQVFTEFMREVSDGLIMDEVEDADELFRQLSIYLGRNVGPHDFEYCAPADST